MKHHSILILIVTVAAAGLMLFACSKETKKDAAAPAGEMAPAPADTMTAAPVDPAARQADAHNPEAAGSDPGSAGHVPCGAHSAGTATADGPKYPSVFKAMPVYGTKISCPIKGETFEFSESRPTTEYNGKIYVFGCGGCKAIFLKDPEAALKKYTFTEAP